MIEVEAQIDEKRYMAERLDNQIDWYSGKASKAKDWYIGASVVNLVLSATIPFLSGIASDAWVRVVVGVFGVLAAVVAGLLTLFKWQENWLQYRATSEALKHEKFMFLTETPPYDGEDRFPALVQRVESMISRENSNWSQYIKQKEE